jgi:hypothetical protein
MRIGLVDIDTSHPENWIPFIRAMGHEIIGVWDGASVHSTAYVRDFVKQHAIPRLFDRLEAMPALVDCAIIHSCNWDLHIDRAAPFVAAGKAILIDKPLAGRLAHLQQLLRWAREGHKILGGSSLRFTNEIAEFLARPQETRGRIHTVFTGCGIDEFNYGIHAYSLMCSIIGPGARTVRSLGVGTQWQIEITWDEGRRGIVTIGAGPWLPCYATIVTTSGVHHITPATTPEPLYRSLLTAALPYLAGDAPAPLEMAELIEPELVAIAALQSRDSDGRPILLSDVAQTSGYDGATFVVEYKRQRGK